jgi:iron complex transport system substrate-binding protein
MAPCAGPDSTPTGGPLEPRRVVTLLASGTEIVCALDCGDRLVGRSHECDHPAWVTRLPAVTAPRIRTDVPSAGIDRDVRALVAQALSVYDVDAARLAALEPDLIVTQVQCEVCAVSLRDVEEAVRAALPTRPAIVSLRPDALADVWNDMRAIADALGVPERGVQLVTRLRARMRAIAERTRGRPPVRVACVEWIEPLMAAGNWTPELLATAGATDVLGHAGEHAGAITFEALAAADPDVIWITPCGFDLARTRAEMRPLAAHPDWPALRAVRGGNIFLGDGNALFNRPGPRVVESLECLAEALHPDAFRFGHEGTGWARWPTAPATSSPRGAPTLR